MRQQLAHLFISGLSSFLGPDFFVITLNLPQKIIGFKVQYCLALTVEI